MNDEMTLEKLSSYQKLMAEIKAVQAEIEGMYYPVTSPQGHTDGIHSTMPGSPTESAVARITKKKEELEELLGEMIDTLEEIERWTFTVEDREIRAIVRYHFVIGLSWKRTSLELGGVEDYWYARQKFYRWWNKKGEENGGNANIQSE